MRCVEDVDADNDDHNESSFDDGMCGSNWLGMDRHDELQVSFRLSLSGIWHQISRIELECKSLNGNYGNE